LKDVRVIALDHVALLAAPVPRSVRGAHPEAVRELSDPDLILFVDELHNLIGRHGARRRDGRGTAEARLGAGRYRIIGATTGASMTSGSGGDPALDAASNPSW